MFLRVEFLLLIEKKGFLKKNILKMWKISKKGIAFNCLNSKNKLKTSDEFTADPNKVYDFCKKLSKNIKLNESYYLQILLYI